MSGEEVKDLVAKNLSEYFKSIGEELSFRKVAKSLYIFITTPDEVEKYIEIMQSSSSHNCIHRDNIEIFDTFDPELKLINTKKMIKNKLK